MYIGHPQEMYHDRGWPGRSFFLDEMYRLHHPVIPFVERIKLRAPMATNYINHLRVYDTKVRLLLAMYTGYTLNPQPLNPNPLTPKP